jgi:hypothetical protein
MGNGSYASRDDVTAMGESLLERVFERMDQETKFRHVQHEENKQLMRDMLIEAKATNGRVTRLEAAMQTLKDEFGEIRKRWHAFSETVQKTIGHVELSLAAALARATTDGKGELTPVTRLDIKTAVGIFCLGMGAVIALLKLGKGLL